MIWSHNAETAATPCRLARTGYAIGVCIAVALASAPLVYGQEARQIGQILPISASACDDMKVHHVLGPDPPVGCARLRLVKFRYVDFAGSPRDDGEIVVMDAAASHVLQIFKSLFRMRFPIAKARPMQSYDGDDETSMRDNNTSAFNDRPIAGSATRSLHAYGLAIDVNPIQNPSLTRNGAALLFAPPAGVEYANRLNDRPFKQQRPGMAEAVVDVFAENGFLIWGGYWDSPIDYQHFQVGRKFAERLTALSAGQAEVAFNELVQRYRRCRNSSGPARRQDRISCIVQTDPAANQP